jgi:ABC-type Mn2+/Zn2+ transport system permease subunit
VSGLLDPFSAPYELRALAELVLLALLAGTLGTWIVLRRMAFLAHAAGTATFPGLVVAAPWGVAPQLAALGAAGGFAALLAALLRTRRLDAGAATGVLLVGALALGAILASDVYSAGAGVDALLLGSLLGVDARDLALTGAAVVLVLALDAVLGRSWARGTFEPATSAAGADAALVSAIALAAVVAVDAVGALLAGVVLVVPAATARLLTDDLREMRIAATALALAEGTAALWLAVRVDVGPGPVLALIGGAVFVAASLYAAARRPAVAA